jgi:hypothetical protein
VVVFDDVLPRNQHEAAREQCPGDWTGDVWKVPRLLSLHGYTVHLVDTFPTGTAVVYGLDPGISKLQDMYNRIVAMGLDQWNTVPQGVLSREGALTPEAVMDRILDWVDIIDLTKEE